MRFTPSPIKGSVVVELEPRTDDRGFFSRSFCVDEFVAAGIEHQVVQENVSFNHRAGTVRGIHWQEPPNAEGKFVRCTRGQIFDVVVDLRPESPTYTKWFGITLTADNHNGLYVPPRCGHAYLTLADNTEVSYQVSARYAPTSERGLRPDDPAIGIAWPAPIEVISTKDSQWESFDFQKRKTTDLRGADYQ